MLTKFWLTGLIFAASVTAEWPPPAENPKPLVGRLFDLVQASVTGKRPDEWYATRDEDDKASGVIRLTDENYHELVEEGSPDTVWVVNVHAEKIIDFTNFFDAHTNATRLFPTLTALGVASDQDVNGKHVKFARIDFQAEWKICTRWMLFKPPRLMFVSDNGKTIRSLTEREMVPDGERLAKWLKDGEWTNLQIWDGSFSPGGDFVDDIPLPAPTHPSHRPPPYAYKISRQPPIRPALAPTPPASYLADNRTWLIERYISLFQYTSKIRSIPPIVWMTISGLIGRYLLEWFWGSNPTGAPPKPSQAGGTKPVISKEGANRYADAVRKRHAAGATTKET